MATGQYLCRWLMDDLSTFLELPLDRELYKPKYVKCVKPPLRILVTEGGSRAAHHLMYYICSGQVFGPDQEIIIHLLNAKGFANHKGILVDIEECGFFALKDMVVSAKPEITYGEVDIVVLIAFFEELSGHSLTSSLIHQVIKARNVAKNMRMYSKPDAKLVVCSPSTKGVVILLTCLRTSEPDIPIQNMTGVTLLDDTIAKHLIAAKLKVTTDRIKNIVIWGATCPDVHNATVYMYPPDDRGNVKMVDIPVLEVLNDHKWLCTDFIMVYILLLVLSTALYRRLSNSDLTSFGGAVAAATAKHLKLLFRDTDIREEILSMGTIVPPSEPYGLQQEFGFSLPVMAKNGQITIREGIPFETSTHLTNIKTMYNLHQDKTLKLLFKLLHFIGNYEQTKNEAFIWTEHIHLWRNLHGKTYILKCIISPRENEHIALEKQDLSNKKSIGWEEGNSSPNKNAYNPDIKSSLRFNT